ncbi:MAG: S41 family peptidase [Clostridium sp.]|nr:S41 family peptidase [Clostridium sp.]
MKKLILGLVVAWMCAGRSAAQESGNHNFEISKNLEIFNNIYKQLDRFYVDTLSADTVIGWAINAMLNKVDPFTVHFAETNMDDLKTMTTGKYAGIGSVIRYIKSEDRVVIAEPYEGSPSDVAGVKAGDVILKVDDKDVKGMSTTEVSRLLRGDAGTRFVLTVKRPGTDAPVALKITRENIQLPAVPYYGMLTGGTGYLMLNSFTDGCSREVRRAIVDLKEQGMQSLVFDLRGNPGGSLAEAVEIVSLFVPKGQKVVYTKGKLSSSNMEYFTQKPPLDAGMPLVVLVDGGSASAAEIVSGALQDLDRAVIVGMRTYGKGLVQTLRDTPYHGNLKVTTSRYYIPSGRCIQAYDYRHLNADGSVGTVPDSLTRVFHTAAGREVRDGGGIKPDVVVRPDSLADIVYEVAASDELFNYVTRYVADHKEIAPAGEFELSDEDYDAFVREMVDSGFACKYRSSSIVDVLEKTLRRDGVYDRAKDKLDELKELLTPDLEGDLRKNRKEIRSLIVDEIIPRYYYQKGTIVQHLKDDVDLKEAMRILTTEGVYDELLGKQK